MNEVDNLTKRRLELEKEISDIGIAIRTIQNNCNHTWVSDGHDSHYRYEKCTKCSKIDKI